MEVQRSLKCSSKIFFGEGDVRFRGQIEKDDIFIGPRIGQKWDVCGSNMIVGTYISNDCAA